MNKIISLLGPRRAGKTYVLFNIIKQVRKAVGRNRVVYVNFEDDRLFPLTISDLDDLLKAYYELYPHHKGELVYFFLDEIQEVDGWEKFVRRLDDQENSRIYVTGSSSKLLSRDIATALRGRSISYEILPLSFKEYLRFKQIDVNPNTTKGEATALHHLEVYMKQGGFPELLNLPVELHGKVINEYLDLMLYRDLVERYDVKQPRLLKYLLKHTLVNLSKPLSINKIFNDIKSQGYRVGKNTIYEYMHYLEEAFVLFPVKIWSQSIRKQAVNPMKVYAIDPAYKYAMSIEEDLGRVFENLVYMSLRRKGINPSYVLYDQEVDFYWEGGQLTNVSYSLSDEQTKRREIKSLFQAMDKMGHKSSTLYTWDHKEVIRSHGKTVMISPLWKFLLDDDM